MTEPSTPPPKPDRSKPLWQQIELQLLQDIRRGLFAEGERLPSGFELAERFQVNRHTVRRAMKSLEERGMVRTLIGGGCFVQEHPYLYPIGRRTRMGRAMHDLNVESRYEMIDAQTLVPTPQVRTALGLVAGERVHRIVYVSLVEEHVVDHSEAFFPATRFPGLADTFRRCLSVTRTLQAHGVTDYLRKHTAITARLPEPDVARALGQTVRRPVLCVHSLNIDMQGVPVQFGITCFAGNRVQLVVSPDN